MRHDLVYCGDPNGRVLEAKIVTVSGMLEWIHAEAEKSKRAWKSTPLLVMVIILLRNVLNKISSQGIESFDPEEAGVAAAYFRKISQLIRNVGAHSDVSGVDRYFPYNQFLPRLMSQGHCFEELAPQLEAIDALWRRTLETAAKESIDRSLKATVSNYKEPQGPETYSGPSDEALRAHLHRSIKSTQ